MTHSRKIRNRSGFTLMELMVAMTITTIIISILVSITSIALDTWTRNRAEVRAARQGKAMVDSLANDFEAMVVRSGNNFQWLWAEASTSGLGTETFESSNASELIFFTAATDRYNGDLSNINSMGDVSCVAYQLKYQDPIQGQDAAKGKDANPFSTFVLYRSIVDPDATFRDLLGSDDLERSFARYMNRRSEVQNFVCENVYQYTVTFQVEVAMIGSDGAPFTKTGRVTLGNSADGVREFRVYGSNLEILRGRGASLSTRSRSGGGDRPGDGVRAGSLQGARGGMRPPPNSNLNRSRGTSSSAALLTPQEMAKGRITAVEVSLTVLTDSAIDQMRNRTFKNEEARADFVTSNSFQFSKVVELPKQ